MSNRGTCAKCGRAMQVRADGLIRTHRDLADNRCLGGGQPPIWPAFDSAPLPNPMAARLVADELEYVAKSLHCSTEQEGYRWLMNRAAGWRMAAEAQGMSA